MKRYRKLLYLLLLILLVVGGFIWFQYTRPDVYSIALGEDTTNDEIKAEIEKQVDKELLAIMERPEFQARKKWEAQMIQVREKIESEESRHETVMSNLNAQLEALRQEEVSLPLPLKQ